MDRYQAVPRRVWVNSVTNATASMFGAHPAKSAADVKNWTIEERYWTIHDKVNNTYGVFSCPHDANQAFAEGIANQLNALAREVAHHGTL
jgi:hypothetical protein